MLAPGVDPGLLERYRRGADYFGDDNILLIRNRKTEKIYMVGMKQARGLCIQGRPAREFTPARFEAATEHLKEDRSEPEVQSNRLTYGLIVKNLLLYFYFENGGVERIEARSSRNMPAEFLAP